MQMKKFLLLIANSVYVDYIPSELLSYIREIIRDVSCGVLWVGGKEKDRIPTVL